MIPMVAFSYSANPGDESPGNNMPRAGWHFFLVFFSRAII
jgi:hypothetical protein